MISRNRLRDTLLLAVALLVPFVSPMKAQTIIVVNMIPATSSGETNDDSEPNLAVNPVNPMQMVATAFTPDPMDTPGVAPIFVSSDGGQTWTLYSILTIPTNNICVGGSTCDITPRFSEVSGNLYLSWLTADASFNIPLNVARNQPFPVPPPAPTSLQNFNTVYPNIVDQPFLQAWTALSGPNAGDDRVFIGMNDLRGGTGGKTASMDDSQTAENAPPAGFAGLQGVEARSTCGQDGPPIRPAVHSSGVIYSAFYRWTAGCGGATTTDVVVTRDDNWASVSPPFQALTDVDTLAGKRVVTGISLPPCNSTVGHQRVCGSLSIAVDPNNNQNVWLVWADGTGASNYTLHVRNSSDGGNTWSSDLKTVTPAINPALAISTVSKVGFLYQKLANPGTCNGGTVCWETHFQTTTHGSSWTDTILANTPDTLTSSINNVLGDYEYLGAVGRNFYGIFSANNLPFQANFPQGVTYQRFADLTSAHALYKDGGHTTTINASVDPYFFTVTNEPASEDYYVRDWTASTTSHDNGEEPSTNPVWWTTSDVWNRLTNTAGAFNGNDQPAQQTAQDATSGHNFAFVRIHRKAPAAMSAPNEQVSASFLFADYGLGVPYEYVTGSPLSSTAALTFAASDTVQTLADGAGVQWDLPAERSTHVCMAVEIAGPDDPYSPELLGRAPGWPTDLLITTDNNKAQINMDLPPVSQGGFQLSSYALVHNAALFLRDVQIQYEVTPDILRKLEGSSVLVVGGESTRLNGQGTLVLKNMQPGESRWIGVGFQAPLAKPGDELPVNFKEIIGGNAINGITVSARVGVPDELIRANLKSHRADFNRLAKAFQVSDAEKESEAATGLLKSASVGEKDYLGFLAAHERSMGKIAEKLAGHAPGAEKFPTMAALTAMQKAVGASDFPAAANAHASFLNALDAQQTMIQKSEGDPADFLQMVEWQIGLYSGNPKIHATKDARHILEESREFVSAVNHKKAGLEDYPELLRKLLRGFRDTAEQLDNALPNLEKKVAALDEAIERRHIRAVELAHRDFLLALSTL